MADAPNTVAVLNGLYKEVYGDKIVDLVPEGLKVQRALKFSPAEKQLGNSYHQPVLLAYEQGFTHAAASAGAFTLNDAAAGVMKDATLTGSQILLKSQIDYEAAARAANGKGAFKDATKLMFESMQKSMRKRIEIQLLYGAAGIAKVSSLASQVITLQTAEFATGIWSGMEGATIDVYVAATGVVRQAGLVVSSVDLENGTVTVTGTTTGIVNNDTIYFGGAYGKEMTGIYGIMANTGSLFGIDASAYSLWKTPSHSCGSAALSQTKIGKGIVKAVAKGLDGEAKCLVNPNTWTDLLSDQAALVKHIGKDIKGSVSNGSKAIEFHSQNGMISIEPSIYVKQGHAFVLALENWKRLGACDVTFNTPGSHGGEIFLQIPTKAGFEVRCYTNQAIFCEAPGKNLLLTSITNS
jgi:hypothetical protein